MSDFKQAVIDILTRYRDSWQGDYYVPFRKAIDEISALSEKMQLSQEDTTKDTTSDLISRLDVLQLIRTLPPEEGMTKGLLETSVKQLPSAEPEQQWILCSDRLPKKGENVFVYLFGDSPYIAWHNGIDWYTEDFTVDKDDEPIAWMPLPEAWRGEDD